MDDVIKNNLIQNEKCSGTVDSRGRKRQAQIELSEYNLRLFAREAEVFLGEVSDCQSLEEARERLAELVLRLRIDNSMHRETQWGRAVDRTRDCARAMLCLLSARSDRKTGFSVTRAIWDVSRGRQRADLTPAFFAEIIHIVWGLEARNGENALWVTQNLSMNLTGREAATVRSNELDNLWNVAERKMARYATGLDEETQGRRAQRKKSILQKLGGSESDWEDWNWQVNHVGRNLETLEGLVALSPNERENIGKTCKYKIPFGVTPYYLSLMDEEASPRDRATRAQVFPPRKYVAELTKARQERKLAFDFMQERDTSPIDLITRRYPGIAIFKPYNTCPQICVYCQRNWEIADVMAPDALAPREKIEQAVDWLRQHPAIHEVLITGGDPLLLQNKDLERLLEMVAALPAVQRIRIGTRTLVTLPMRVTTQLADLLGKYRQSGRREVSVVTHVEHPYEVTPRTAAAVERLRMRGISVYNQLVYTFFVSRRFEASLLRILLRQIGIEPYYTFLPKGKSETMDYQVPLSRLLQEQTEEARLLPGLTRTDEAVYNVPKLGKNYLRASKCRDLLTIKPDGTRIYEFHPWEKKIADQKSYIGSIMPIYDYLERIQSIGEDPQDYESLWYYY